MTQLKRSVNPMAVRELEPFLICIVEEDDSRRVIESQFDMPLAIKAMTTLVDHDKKNGHRGWYEIHNIIDVEMVDG